MSEAELKVQNQPVEHLENFFALSIDMLFVAGLEEGYFKSVNPTCTKVLGFTKRELLSMPIISIVHPDDRESALKELERLRSGIPTIFFECRFLKKNNGYVWLSWRCAPADGLIYAVARDLTEKKEREALYDQAREKLVANSKLSELGEMAGGIAHEINNPLSVILGRSGLLLNLLKNSKDPHSGDFIEIATQIEATSLRIARIVQGLRYFSRDGANDNLESASVESIVNDTLSFCAQKFKANNVHLQVASFSSDLSLQCRPVQISQVLLNLANNSYYAVKTLKERWIRIEIEDKSKQIEIAVTDSGQGLSESLREKLFQPFFTTKPIGAGTGLGLSISKGIIESHNGKLELDATSQNTRFVISLPKVQK